MVFYFVALVLSVLWNFTINRSVTFKSVGNVPKAMLKVLGYYVVYTPLSLLFAKYGQGWGIPEMVITVINILINGVTEYLFMRLFVFKKEIDTRNEETKKPLSFLFVFVVAWTIALLLIGVNAVVLAHSKTTMVVLWIFVGLTGATLLIGLIYFLMKLHYKKQGREFGDRKDAKLIRNVDGIHIAMAHCYPRRTDNEAYISETIELDPIKDWIAKHKDEEFKYTFFHVIVAALLKLLIVRPKLNRFICNKKYYQKNERSLGFIVKRQFNLSRCKWGYEIIFDTKGNIYPCQYMLRFPEKKLSHYMDNRRLSEIQKPIYSNELDNCKTCWAEYICGGTCHYSSYVEEGDIYKTNRVECKYNKNLSDFF